MLSMQHCNKGGGYQWSQSSVQSRWWVGYVLLSEWLQCSLVSYTRQLQCCIGWVGGIRITYQRKNWGLDGKPQRGSPRHSNHQHPEMLLEKVFESVSSLYLLLPKTGSNNIKKNKIQKSPLSRNAA